MPVSPTQKQDLMLVKDVFEKKALLQDTSGATWLPMVTTVQQTRRIHETIQGEAARYPAAVSQQKVAKNDQSFLKQKQIECIPCLDRIRAVGDVDMFGDLFASMIAYNDRALKNMLNLFKSVSRPNRIQENLCGAYTALRSQCVPDITRLLSQLTLLMNHLRGFNLKSLKDQLISLLGALIIRNLVTGAINYDMYINLITNVTRCIVTDINTQLTKLEPILSREGLEDIAKLLPLERDTERRLPRQPGDPEGTFRTESGRLVNNQTAAERKAANWFPDQGDFNYAQDISKQIVKAEGNFESKLNTFTGQADKGVAKAAKIGRIISDMIEESISVVDSKLTCATSEMLKFLKLSDGNLSSQIQLLDQIQLIRSVLEVLKTIKDTRGDFDPCGKDAGRRFFTRIKFPGQDIIVTVDDSDPDNPELDIIPPGIKIDNPVVEEILNANGIDTGPIGESGAVKSGRVVSSVPVSINISKCLDGKQ